MAQYGRVHALSLDQGHQYGRVHELKLTGTAGPQYGRVHELQLTGSPVTSVECGQWISLPAQLPGRTWIQDAGDMFQVSRDGTGRFWAPLYVNGVDVRFNASAGGAIIRYHVYAHTVNGHNATEGWYPVDLRTLNN